MRNMKIITCLLTITSLVFTACGGGSNDIEKAKSVATTEHLKRYTEAISHDSCQGRKPFSEGRPCGELYRSPNERGWAETYQRRFLFPTG